MEKIYILMKENSIVDMARTCPTLPESGEPNTAYIEAKIHEIFLPLLQSDTDLSHYSLQNGHVVHDATNDEILREAREQLRPSEKEIIRARRQKECFAVVDRPLWLKNLPENRQIEIENWYQQWLSATETLVVPEKPNWL